MNEFQSKWCAAYCIEEEDGVFRVRRSGAELDAPSLSSHDSRAAALDAVAKLAFADRKRHEQRGN
jgi:hypothetical protein